MQVAVRVWTTTSFLHFFITHFPVIKISIRFLIVISLDYSEVTLFLKDVFQKYPENFTFQLQPGGNLPVKFAIVFSVNKQNFTAQ